MLTVYSCTNVASSDRQGWDPRTGSCSAHLRHREKEDTRTRHTGHSRNVGAQTSQHRLCPHRNLLESMWHFFSRRINEGCTWIAASPCRLHTHATPQPPPDEPGAASSPPADSRTPPRPATELLMGKILAQRRGEMENGVGKGICHRCSFQQCLQLAQTNLWTSPL